MLKKSSYLISRFFATTAGSLYGFAFNSFGIGYTRQKISS